MINKLILNKVLFFDLETCGQVSTLDELDERLANLWHKRCDLLRSKYKDTNGDMTDEQLWQEKSGLHPEFGRICCASFGYFNEQGDLKLTSYYGEDELSILEQSKKLINKVAQQDFSLCGHTVKRFDVPYFGKRMLINGICPPSLLNLFDKKPWEMKILDIAEIFSFGAWQEGFTGLDTMCAVLDIESPKAEYHGSKVHAGFYNGESENIKKYCEKDVKSTAEVFKKFCLI
jgi:DNA polymerase elongation subunit (family B)